MRSVQFKEGVVVKELTPALMWIFECLGTALNSYSWLTETVVTSVNDGLHAKTSRHYTNEAVDVRAKHFKTLDEKRNYMEILDLFLNQDPEALKSSSFVILHEYVGTDNEHFHIQVRKGITYP